MPRRLLCLSGPSGAGKTTLGELLVEALVRRGLSVAVVKHTHHPLPGDTAESDTGRYAAAGAAAVALAGPGGLRLFLAGEEPSPAVLSGLFPAVDLVLLEGYKGSNLPKVEVLPRGSPAPDPERQGIVAVVGEAVTEDRFPAFRPDELERLAGFVAAWLAGSGE